MSKEERQQYKADAKIAINYLSSIFNSYKENKRRETVLIGGFRQITEVSKFTEFKARFEKAGKLNIYNQLNSKLAMVESWKAGAEWYQYNCIYLCVSKWKAENYARNAFAGGEFGSMAYWLIKGTDFLQLPEYNPPANIKSIIDKIRAFGDSKPQPVVITINNINREDLLLENGMNVPWDVYDNMPDGDFSFRYLKDITLDLSNAEYL